MAGEPGEGPQRRSEEVSRPPGVHTQTPSGPPPGIPDPFCLCFVWPSARGLMGVTLMEIELEAPIDPIPGVPPSPIWRFS